MTTLTTQQRFWQSLKRALTGDEPDQRDGARRISVYEVEAYTLPRHVRRVRVVSGGAWISYKREDILLYAGQDMHLHPEQDGVVITAIGHRPVVLDLFE